MAENRVLGGALGGTGWVPPHVGREFPRSREAQALFTVIWCVTFPEEGPSR